MSIIGGILPTIHYDATEFRKKNPDASEMEFWNYLGEKYNLPRSAEMMTLEEAYEYILPLNELSTDPTTLTK